MTSFDYLSGRRHWCRRANTLLSAMAREGLLTLFLACALLLAAAWALEAQKLHRARVLEERWTRQVERSRIESARIDRRYRRAVDVTALLGSIDAAVGSGAEEARRLTELAGALPAKSWLTALSGDVGEFSLEGGAADLPELGRTLGAVGDLSHVGSATLVEAVPFLQERAPEALRYRIRVTRVAP